MKLDDFDYYLPKELIAQYPLKMREEARLLVLYRKKQLIEHRLFRNITEYLSPSDLLVLNDTKVLPCRLFAKRATGGKVEVLLLNRKEGAAFKAMISPGRVKLGEKILFPGTKITAEVRAKEEIIFNTADADRIYAIGVMPLPPYIKRPAQEQDNEYYQTVYAKKDGAVAAPTAGLHFTQALLKDIAKAGVGLAYLTLHVGLGTFRPVKAEDITKHLMEPEYFEISDQAAIQIEAARKNKSRIIAVGTTSLKALETYAGGAQRGQTDLFIYPGYKFKLANGLLTNFHLPKTTLFMLVCAFCAAGGAGVELAKKAYQEAIKEKYRFYSYGDAMLIL